MQDSNFLAEQLALVAGFKIEETPHRRSALTDEAIATLARARALTRTGDLQAAAALAETAVAASPRSPDARALLGALRLETGDPTAAAPHLAAAVSLAPHWAEASRLCGEAAFRANDLGAARTHLQKALTLRPSWPEAALRLAEVLLKAGDYAEGFRSYEARFAAARQRAPGPLWDGQAPLWGKSVVILAEREIGDLVQFVRYADLLKRRGAKVFVTCPADLVGLMETVPGVARAVPFGMDVAAADYQIPLLSLPRVFGTTLGTVPAEVPYLSAECGAAATWRAHLAGLSPAARVRVGVVWSDAGEPSPVPVRGVPLADLSPLWGVPGVAWFALQQGPPHAEMPFNETPLIDVSADLTGPGQIVAALDALDLLISVDTPAAHVAGALNRPCWTLLAAGCDWRWLGRGETTPWYPSVRCFRQDTAGDWEPVARRVASALEDVVAGR